MCTDNKLRFAARGRVGGDGEGGNDNIIPVNPTGETFRLWEVSV